VGHDHLDLVHAGILVAMTADVARFSLAGRPGWPVRAGGAAGGGKRPGRWTGGMLYGHSPSFVGSDRVWVIL
jgi:hypothetical protein